MLFRQSSLVTISVKIEAASDPGVQPHVVGALRNGVKGAMWLMVSIPASLAKQANKKKLKMGMYLVALCFDSQQRKLKKQTNKQTNRLLLKHIFEVTHVV